MMMTMKMVIYPSMTLEDGEMMMRMRMTTRKRKTRINQTPDHVLGLRGRPAPLIRGQGHARGHDHETATREDHGEADRALGRGNQGL